MISKYLINTGRTQKWNPAIKIPKYRPVLVAHYDGPESMWYELAVFELDTNQWKTWKGGRNRQNLNVYGWIRVPGLPRHT